MNLLKCVCFILVASSNDKIEISKLSVLFKNNNSALKLLNVS